MAEAQAAKLADNARAKINLTLSVLGRRDDGYHALESLVVFAAPADRVELEPDDDLALTVDGPFAGALSEANLVMEAARAAKAAAPALRLGHFHLIKNLPVAAGLGGGSADAAAALRLLATANGDLLKPDLITALAAQLGSDVSVCVESRAALMSGRGEVVAHLPGFPSCGVVLANAGQALATAKVFAALDAPPLSAQPVAPEAPDFAGSFENLLDYVRPRPNHLERVASKQSPAIGETLAALGALKGARLARLSGSGPACFALFASPEEADREGALMAAAQPDWWVASGALQ